MNFQAFPAPGGVSDARVYRQKWRISPREARCFFFKGKQHFVAIHYMFYNFGRIHQSLRVTPAMEAGVSNHVWNLEEIVGLLP
jgi:hypothetical protein